jgi:hypothetical protein
VSAAEGDPQKVACAHNSLRTGAKASAKVGSRLWYQAAGLHPLPVSSMATWQKLTGGLRASTMLRKRWHFGAAIKANPPRGGGAKPRTSYKELAGLPKGGGVVRRIIVDP